MARATRFNGAAVPTNRVNLNRSKAVLPVTGSSTTPPPPLQGHRRATGLHLHRAGRLLHCGTGVYSAATPQQKKSEETYPDLRFHRGTQPF